MAEPRVYVCNASFDGYRQGEFVTANPLTVQDWLDAGFITEVDGDGQRVFDATAMPGGDDWSTDPPDGAG